MKRVVMTSSFAAIIFAHDHTVDPTPYTDKEWNDKSKPTPGDVANIYRTSKIEAEKAAWQYVKENAVGFSLVTICPPMVVRLPLHLSLFLSFVTPIIVLFSVTFFSVWFPVCCSAQLLLSCSLFRTLFIVGIVRSVETSLTLARFVPLSIHPCGTIQTIYILTHTCLRIRSDGALASGLCTSQRFVSCCDAIS